MTWAELIREYYKKCMETKCLLSIDIESELGSHYIFMTAHRGKKIKREIIGYVGLGGAEVGERMLSYDTYKDPDYVVNTQIENMVKALKEGE